MKKKFCAALVALCALSAGIPAAASAGTPTGNPYPTPVSGEYCQYYVAEYYCTGKEPTKAQQIADEVKAGNESLGIKFFETTKITKITKRAPRASVKKTNKHKVKYKITKTYSVGGSLSFATYKTDMIKGIAKINLDALLADKTAPLTKTYTIITNGVKHLTIDYTKGDEGHFVKDNVKKDFHVTGIAVGAKKDIDQPYSFKLEKSGSKSDATLVVTLDKATKDAKFSMDKGLIDQTAAQQKAAKKAQSIYVAIGGESSTSLDDLPAIVKK